MVVREVLQQVFINGLSNEFLREVSLFQLSPIGVAVNGVHISRDRLARQEPKLSIMLVDMAQQLDAFGVPEEQWEEYGGDVKVSEVKPNG